MENICMRLILIRHAQSVSNVTNIHELDPILTMTGHEQALQLVPFFAKMQTREIWCSTMLRSILTVEPWSKIHPNYSVRVMPELMETYGYFRHKQFDGYEPGPPTTEEQIKKLIPQAEIFPYLEVMGCEKKEDILNRVFVVWDRIRMQSLTKEQITIVSHGNFLGYLINVLLCLARGVPLDHLDQGFVEMANGAVSIFDVFADQVTPVCLNCPVRALQ